MSDHSQAYSKSSLGLATPAEKLEQKGSGEKLTGEVYPPVCRVLELVVVVQLSVHSHRAWIWLLRSSLWAVGGRRESQQEHHRDALALWLCSGKHLSRRSRPIRGAAPIAPMRKTTVEDNLLMGSSNSSRCEPHCMKFAGRKFGRDRDPPQATQHEVTGPSLSLLEFVATVLQRSHIVPNESPTVVMRPTAYLRPSAMQEERRCAGFFPWRSQ